jgi:hypothetical protein
MSPSKWEQRSRRSSLSTKLSYLQLKDMKPSGNLEYCVSGRLPFSQSQTPTHTGSVWSETFASVPWSFLIRPNANSHTHNLVLRPLPQLLELSHKARYQLTQARSHCWLQHFPLFYFLNIAILA